MIKSIEVMRKAADLLNEECDRVEHGVVKGGEVPEGNCIVVKLEYPNGCKKCIIYPICQIHVCGSIGCDRMWDNLIEHHKNLASHKK